MRIRNLVIPMDVYPLVVVVSGALGFGTYTTYKFLTTSHDVAFNKSKYPKPTFLSPTNENPEKQH
jgi:hypothetical protein